MSKLVIRGLIIGMGISLVGLSIFQVYWIKSIVTANEEGFNREVFSALADVAEKLEKKEVMQVAVDNFHSNFIIKTPSNGDSSKLELFESSFNKKVIAVQDYARDTANRTEWMSFYFNTEKETPKLKNVSISKQEMPISNENPIYQATASASLSEQEREFQIRIKRIAQKSEFIQLAMYELCSGGRNLASRIDFNETDSLLEVSLKARGIFLAYDFGVGDSLTKNFIVEKITASKRQLLSSNLRTNLFPNDIMGEAGYLIVRFPNQQYYLMSKIWLTLVSSVFFIIIILVCFGYAIRTIFLQKKLSEIKNDFINNMTHEFKTPIATVSLACEALRDHQVNDTLGLKERYLGIIQDENKRLGLQVEKVLQMAVIDREDFEMKLEILNIHDLITRVISNLSIQITNDGGVITKELYATNTQLTADRMHLTNIISNLLDNANKYSLKPSKIKIATLDANKGIIIKILDEGMGMSKDMLNKIFEKFYRIPTGNRHDVKGFGLGLTYVKNMVEAHGGHIGVNSELYKGSQFTIYLPLEKEIV